MYSITEHVTEWVESTTGIHAGARPPKDEPQCPVEFFTVQHMGGQVADLVDHPMVAVQAWAQTGPRAEEMALAVRMEALTGTLPPGVHSMRVNSGPYPYYDEETRCPRYQVVFDITSQLTE